MKLQRFVLGLLVAAGIVYFVYAIFTETGIVGWLNHGQQSLFGAYSLKLSAAGLMVVMMIGGGALYGAALSRGWLREDRDATRVLFGAEAVGEPATGLSGGVLAWTCVVMLAITWGIGLGLFAWAGWQERDDVAADYPPVTLVDGAPAPLPAGRHLALQGRVLAEHILTHSRGSGASARDDYHLVPITAPGWRAGQPVTYVVKVARLAELDRFVDALRRGEDARLLVRLDGVLPVPAVQAFGKLGVPLAGSHHMLAVVPARDGRPVASGISERDWQFMLMLCGGISGIIVLTIPLVWWRTRGLRGAGRPAAARA